MPRKLYDHGGKIFIKCEECKQVFELQHSEGLKMCVVCFTGISWFRGSAPYSHVVGFFTELVNDAQMLVSEF